MALFGANLAGTALADEQHPVPHSCKLQPTKVVNPGCISVLTSEARDPESTLPNIVPDVRDVAVLRSFEWDPESETFFEGAPALYFDTWAQNLGTVPLQLTVDDLETPENSSVSQCVSWVERICRKQVPVGGYTWHAEHAHFHFEEFATYDLRRLAPDGRPDYSSSGIIATSDKVSFCMVDSAQVRQDAFPIGFYNLCTPTVQGISPGWADIYDSSLPGQQFDIAGLADGQYALVVAQDYANRLQETDDSDNVVEITLEIADGGTSATIVGRNYP